MYKNCSLQMLLKHNLKEIIPINALKMPIVAKVGQKSLCVQYKEKLIITFYSIYFNSYSIYFIYFF